MKSVSVPIIQTSEDLDQALARLEALMLLPGSDDDEIRILGLVIHAHEAELIKSRELDPVEVLEFVLSERAMPQSDLVPYIGSNLLVSEILSRKQNLSLEMIQNLSQGLGIPAATLIGASKHTVAA